MLEPDLPDSNLPEKSGRLHRGGRFLGLLWVFVAAAAAAKPLQSCPTVRPHRRQPTRLHCPWDSPGKNTGVGCHFLLQCMKVKSESEVSQSRLTLSDPMDCSLPGSSVHGIFQARGLEWGATAMRWLFSSCGKQRLRSVAAFSLRWLLLSRSSSSRAQASVFVVLRLTFFSACNLP